MKAFIRYTFEDGHIEDEDQSTIEKDCEILNSYDTLQRQDTPLSLLQTRMYNRITQGKGYWLSAKIFIHSKIVKGEIFINE